MLNDTPLSDTEELLARLIKTTDDLAQCTLRENTPAMRAEARRLHSLVGELLVALPD
jgi:hypothetical protein